MLVHIGRRLFDRAPSLESERLRLAPLTVDDADEMVSVLGDERLHEFIGGRPADLAELRIGYAAMIAGSVRPEEIWMNWIVRRRSDGEAIGTVQATLNERDGQWSALVAWVVGVPWQGQGYASEAARTLVDWLAEQGVADIAAHIHPDHHASAGVAAHAGLHVTDEDVEGERVWRT
jgi:RimJ/RimL family protein N-acetyltransferase